MNDYFDIVQIFYNNTFSEFDCFWFVSMMSYVEYVCTNVHKCIDLRCIDVVTNKTMDLHAAIDTICRFSATKVSNRPRR